MPGTQLSVIVMMLSALVAVAQAQPQTGEQSALEVGRAFPSIALPLLKDGSPASIADFRGEKIIMHVFASW